MQQSHHKLPIWNAKTPWEDSEKTWDAGAQRAMQSHPLKRLKTLPSMPGITPETAKNLKWKSAKYMLIHPRGMQILRHIFKNPLVYGWRYLCSLGKKRSYLRDKDFFLYGFSSIDAFCDAVKQRESLLVVGFSYCQKPHECPSGRFTKGCIADPENPICRQCDIGKLRAALPEKDIIPLLIPTVHDIGDEIFKLISLHKDKKILFLITACEMTLEMFGDWGNLAGVKGVGVRLDGRICNTFEAFDLSERGIKPGLTVLTEETRSRFLDLVKHLRELKKS